MGAGPCRHVPRSLLTALLLFAMPQSVGGARADPRGPAPGPARIVGGPGVGCIAGAVELPSDGPGWQTVRQSRSHFWGHRSTIAALRLLAEKARQSGIPDLYMNDISMPRGGPMVGVHASHMVGLDADVWLDVTPKPALLPAQRDGLEVPSLVTPDGRGVEPALWSPLHATLIRLATQLPGVDRILVNAAIKRQLCETVTGDRTWLRLVRPFYGHSAHMHIHFRCPPGQPECKDMAHQVPPGDGCDASLQWWFDRLDQPARPVSPPSRPPRPPPLPAACRPIMAAP